MGDLKNYNPEPKLTQYLVENKLITLTVVDIGARGGFSSCWKHYEGVLGIVGFDPDKNQEDISKGQCRAKILSSDGKNRIFYIIRYPASSGFYPPNVEIGNRLQNRDMLNIVDTVEVETCTLDSLELTPDFIKLDVEGAELEILQGGEKTLKNVLGISLEVAFYELFQGEPLFCEINKYLNDRGFVLYDLEPARLERYNPFDSRIKHNVGQVLQGQALYFKDIYHDLDSYLDTEILKLASLLEVFNLEDCAREILNNPRTRGYLQYADDLTT